MQLSPVMLGTVQFGMQYGIANRSGQPTFDMAKEIVQAVFEGGINCFDTAAAYGSSEEVLGRILSELGISNEVTVVTKVPRVPEGLQKTSEIDEFVERTVIRSMNRLRLPYLQVCLFHVEEDFRCAESLVKLKEKGLIRHAGFSVMTPEATKTIVESGFSEAVQIPASILDHRFRKEGILSLSKEKGYGVFVRSVYLQGLLMMPGSEMKGRFEVVKPVIDALKSIAADSGMSVREMALRYVMTLDGCTCTVVGVETHEQAANNIQASQKGKLDKGLMAEIESAVPDLSDEILMPTLWHK